VCVWRYSWASYCSCYFILARHRVCIPILLHSTIHSLRRRLQLCPFASIVPSYINLSCFGRSLLCVGSVCFPRIQWPIISESHCCLNSGIAFPLAAWGRIYTSLWSCGSSIYIYHVGYTFVFAHWVAFNNLTALSMWSLEMLLILKTYVHFLTAYHADWHIPCH
jgi:hypothetical protein